MFQKIKPVSGKEGLPLSISFLPHLQVLGSGANYIGSQPYDHRLSSSFLTRKIVVLFPGTRDLARELASATNSEVPS